MQTRQTNGALEVINDLFQCAKRRACAYACFRTVPTVRFLVAGKLDFYKFNPYVAQTTKNSTETYFFTSRFATIKIEVSLCVEISSTS